MGRGQGSEFGATGLAKRPASGGGAGGVAVAASTLDFPEFDEDGQPLPSVTLEDTRDSHLKLTVAEIESYAYYSHGPAQSEKRRADDSTGFMVRKGSEEEARLDRLVASGLATGPGDWEGMTVTLRRTTIKQALSLRRAALSYRVTPPYTLKDAWRSMKSEAAEEGGGWDAGNLLREHEDALSAASA